MSQSFDDLSIEELQNQLIEIQKKILEKEKLSLIEKISTRLQSHDTAFILNLLDVLDGKKDLGSRPTKEPSNKPAVKKTSRRAGKSEVYLRNGKIFCGIQEIKYIRYDKSKVLRISKEGKGLPPKVSSLPDHIQKIALTLPHKPESRPSANAASTPIEAASVPPEAEVSEATPDAHGLHSEPAKSEPIAEVDSIDDHPVVELPSTEPDASPEPEEDSIQARKPKSPSKRRKTSESEIIQLDSENPDADAVPSIAEAPTTETPETEQLPLQVSFF